MTSSSPPPLRALHQDANSNGDQDERPKPPNPVEVQCAHLIQQEQHAQADENEGPNRNARARLFLHRLSLRNYSRGDTSRLRGPRESRGPIWSGTRSEQVVEPERIGSRQA